MPERQATPQICPSCGVPNALVAHYCVHCGGRLTGKTVAESLEVGISGGQTLQVAQGNIHLRELLALLEQGIFDWRERLVRGTAEIGREQALKAIKDLTVIFDNLAHQLAQGRETVRLTTRLPVMRVYSLGCPVCGRGNRDGATFCRACGTTLSPLRAAGPPKAQRLRILVASASDVGQVRKQNEDSCYTGTILYRAPHPATILLVADGMGGAQAGEEASRLACEAIKRELVTALKQGIPQTTEAWQETLRQVVQLANREIYTQARANIDQRGMGSTLTMLVCVEKQAFLAHVGDSRAYLFNAHGVTEDGTPWLQLSQDHSLVARLVDIGQLTPAEALVHPQRNLIYRVLGTDPQVEVDTSWQTLEGGDRLLLCSDGLTNHVPAAELAQVVLAAPHPAQACAQLIALANQRGGTDNISVVVAQIEPWNSS